MNQQQDRCRERGAAAVEFALVLPLLLTLVFGIVEFGRLYNAQVVLTNAAREAARTMAITNDTSKATSSATAGAPGVTINSVVITPGTGGCSTGGEATATLTSNMTLLTGTWLSFGPSISLKGVGAMQCGG